MVKYAFGLWKICNIKCENYYDLVQLQLSHKYYKKWFSASLKNCTYIRKCFWSIALILVVLEFYMTKVKINSFSGVFRFLYWEDMILSSSSAFKVGTPKTFAYYIQHMVGAERDWSHWTIHHWIRFTNNTSNVGTYSLYAWWPAGLGSSSKCIFFLVCPRTSIVRYKYVTHFSDVMHEILFCNFLHIYGFYCHFANLGFIALFFWYTFIIYII